MRHLAFAVTPCLAQFQGGRYVVLEHPQMAKSWETRLMGLLMRLPGVGVIQFDFCMAGMEGEDELYRAPVRKTTKNIMNSEHLAETLSASAVAATTATCT